VITSTVTVGYYRCISSHSANHQTFCICIVLRILDLDTFAYFNRVYFFNSTDKKQLAKLTEETGVLDNVDLSEPLDIAEDILKYSKEILVKLESTLS